MPVDRDHWARLRHDRRSNWAAGLAVVAAFCATIAWIMLGFETPFATRRSNIAYWASFLPLVVWSSSLTRFERWSVRLLRPVAVLAPVACGGALWIAWRSGSGTTGFVAGLVGIAIAGGIGGIRVYRGSLLEREGPAR